MAKPSYFDLLRHPEWQKMRLRIMERDRFKCTDCGAADKTLNVHHAFYMKGAKPWEYDPSTLRTLCEECHQKRHEDIDSKIKRYLGELDYGTVRMVLGYVRGKLLQYDLYSAFVIEDSDQMFGLGDAFGITEGPDITKLMMARDSEGFITHEQIEEVQVEVAQRWAKKSEPQ